MRVQKSPFVRPLKIVGVEIPQKEKPVGEKFRSSYSNCACGRAGTARVMDIDTMNVKGIIAATNLIEGAVLSRFLLW